MKFTDSIRNAYILSEFHVLKSQDMESFRMNYPGFVPDAWWGYEADDFDETIGRPLWQANQKWLREAWEKHFDIGQWELMRLLTSVFDPKNAIDAIDAAFPTLSPLKPRPSFADVLQMPEELYPYQQAVLYLKEHSKLAKFCEWCKTTPVVAQKYCNRMDENGDTCFTLSRREQKRLDYEAHREARNKKRRAKYGREACQRSRRPKRS
jgi:hypothetical protein